MTSTLAISELGEALIRDKHREIGVPGIDIELTSSTANVILLVVTSLVLVKVGLQVRQLSRSTKELKDAAEKITTIDRNSASQVARLAREISADIGKLRHLDSTDGDPQYQSLR